MFEYIWILLPLGLIIGWYAAKVDSSRKRKLHQYLNLRFYLEKHKNSDRLPLSSDNNSIPLNIEDEGISFTLTLGDAYRRRGEVDKAIEMHEHLLSTLDINDSNRPTVLMSLAKDYSIAGIFDRSESALRELLSTPYAEPAALKLVGLYKQQKDWLQAVGMYERIENHRNLYPMEMAHLYCELAEQSIDENNFEQASFWCHQALTISTKTARANLIQAYIALHNKRYYTVLEELDIVTEKQSSLIPMIVPLIYRAMLVNNNHLFQSWIDKQIEKHPSFFYLKIWKTHFLVLNNSVPQAIQYLSKNLEQTKNLQGVTLLNHLSTLKHGSLQSQFTIYHETFQQVIDYYAQFRCEKCGFILKTLQWHCPSCQSWNTVAPVSDIIALRK